MTDGLLDLEDLTVDARVESIHARTYSLGLKVLRNTLPMSEEIEDEKAARKTYSVLLALSCLACTNMAYSLEVIGFPFRGLAMAGPFRQCLESAVGLQYLHKVGSDEQWRRFMGRDKKNLPGLKDMVSTLGMHKSWLTKYSNASDPLHGNRKMPVFAVQEDLAPHMFFDMEYLSCVAVRTVDMKYCNSVFEKEIAEVAMVIKEEADLRWPQR